MSLLNTSFFFSFSSLFSSHRMIQMFPIVIVWACFFYGVSFVYFVSSNVEQELIKGKAKHFYLALIYYCESFSLILFILMVLACFFPGMAKSFLLVFSQITEQHISTFVNRKSKINGIESIRDEEKKLMFSFSSV